MKKLFRFALLLVLLWSCEKKVEVDEIDLNYHRIFMHYDDTEKLTISYTPSDVTISPDLVWRSSDNEVATINSETKTIEGNKIGTTIISVNSIDGLLSDECKVTVFSYGELYRAPYCTFDASIYNTKALESRKIHKHDENYLIYRGANFKGTAIVYQFYKEKLMSCIAMVNSKYENLVATYLHERYDYLETHDIYHLFKISNHTLAVLSYSNTYQCYLVTYVGTETANYLASETIEQIKFSIKYLNLYNGYEALLEIPK